MLHPPSYCPRGRWSARRKHHLKCLNLELVAARNAGDSSQTRPTLPKWHSGGHSPNGLAVASTYPAAPPQPFLGRCARQAARSLSPHAGPGSPSCRQNSSRRDKGLVCGSLSPTRPRPQPCETLEAAARAAFLCDLKQVHIVRSFLSLKIWA